MRAAIMYGPGDVRVEQVPDPRVEQPADAVVRVVNSCICGSDLWNYHDMEPINPGNRMGHEFLGVVEEIGTDVRSLKKGDVVVAPFRACDNTCDFCLEGFHTSCRGLASVENYHGYGAQSEHVRVPLADGTLVKLPVAEDSALLPSFLTLSDVLCTGHHAAVMGRVSPRTTVTVIGDGAVGLGAVIASKLMGAERIILMGRHEDRIALGRDFGATDIVTERGTAGAERIRELTHGDGTHVVLECVGTREALDTAFTAVRDAGTISRVGAPQYKEGPMDLGVLFRNITVTGGVAPARAYIERYIPEIVEGRVNPGRVFDLTLPLDRIAEGYAAMANRTALKVLVTP